MLSLQFLQETSILEENCIWNTIKKHTKKGQSEPQKPLWVEVLVWDLKTDPT